MRRLPQDPSHWDVDEYVDRLERELTRSMEPRGRLLTQIEFSVLRRYIRQKRQQLRDLDDTILDLKDRIVSARPGHE